jgi:RNA polymerase sigma-70 factor, ECF subfamily
MTAALGDLHDLIRRAQQRDPTAISELYDRFAGLVLRYIYARVAEHELAQDLTQEVFIKVIHGIERFEYRDEKSFLGWIYTIAANVLHSHYRRRHVLATPFDHADDIVDQRSQDDVRSVTERIALQQAMGQLTHDQQQVLTLRFFADLSNSEVAGVLRRTEGAVKAIQHRALQSLQKILSRENDDLTPHPYVSAPSHAYYRPMQGDREHGAVVADLPVATVETRGRG